jgi:hypothetical protein
MMPDKRRPWWKRLIILLSGPAVMLIFLLTVLAVFERTEPEPTKEEWDNESWRRDTLPGGAVRCPCKQLGA